MQEKKSVTGKTIHVAIEISVAVMAGAIFGWEYSILGLGAVLGPWIGGYFGNRKAREQVP